MINNPVDSIISSPLNNLTVNVNATSNTINLSNYFDDLLSSGLVAHFNLASTSNGTIGDGLINVVLFDQYTDGAPLTVQNFENYVNSDSYTNTIIHRSVPGFIVQGGGYIYNNSTLTTIPTNFPVQNEYSSQRSNVEGTIAMALSGSDPNSATDQWFFNLVDNSSSLNSQSFTVFGQVQSQADLATMNAVAAVQTYDLSGGNTSSPFTNVPLTQAPASSGTIPDDNFIRFSSITYSQEPSLTFSIVGNTDPTLVTPTINNDQLVLSYAPDQTGSANITVQATNLFDQTVNESFTVSVQQPNNSPLTIDPVYRFYDAASNEHFYTANTSERDLLINNPSFGYSYEGPAFGASLTDATELIPIERFYNPTTADHFFTADQSEADSLMSPNSDYNYEGIAFYAFPATSIFDSPVYRFFNASTGQHLFTANAQEIAGLSSSWTSEGVSFNAAT